MKTFYVIAPKDLRGARDCLGLGSVPNRVEGVKNLYATVVAA